MPIPPDALDSKTMDDDSQQRLAARLIAIREKFADEDREIMREIFKQRAFGPGRREIDEILARSRSVLHKSQILRRIIRERSRIH